MQVKSDMLAGASLAKLIKILKLIFLKWDCSDLTIEYV